MDEKWQQLKDWISESDNIVFLAEPAYPPKAGYRIFAA